MAASQCQQNTHHNTNQNTNQEPTLSIDIKYELMKDTVGNIFHKETFDVVISTDIYIRNKVHQLLRKTFFMHSQKRGKKKKSYNQHQQVSHKIKLEKNTSEKLGKGTHKW